VNAGTGPDAAATPGQALLKALVAIGWTITPWEDATETERAELEGAAQTTIAAQQPHRDFAGEIIGELRQALGADPDGEPEAGETPEGHAIRLAHYLKERIDELHGLVAAEQPQPAPKVHAHQDDLFDAWWDETYEPDEGDPAGAPDRHVPRDAFHAGWDHARALLAPNGVEPQPAPGLRKALEGLVNWWAVGGNGIDAASQDLISACSAELLRVLDQYPESQPAPEPGTADRIIRDILESLCRRDGLSLESAVEPGEPARNYALAERLGIGHVFGLPDTAPAASQPAPGVTVEALEAALTDREILVNRVHGQSGETVWRATPLRPHALAVQLLSAVDIRLTDDPEPQPAPGLVEGDLAEDEGVFELAAILAANPDATNPELARIILAQWQRPQPAPAEIRTCYCGTTATVVPGVFPHPDCDGSARPQPAPGLDEAIRRIRSALEDAPTAATARREALEIVNAIGLERQ
jgi:hypothetical protein